MKYYAIRQCANCGKDVYIYHRKRLNIPNVCCSTKCSGEFRKASNLNCTCPICGKKFHVSAKYLEDSIHEPCCSYECMGKYRSIKYLGEANPNFGNRADNNPLFAGERILHCGYYWLYAPSHPFARDGAGNRVREHRLVAECLLLTEENSVMINGIAYLNPKYDVHHINRNKLDNDERNLMVLTRSEHAKIHAEDKLHPKH